MTVREVPGLGAVEWDDASDWYVSEPVDVAALGGVRCSFLLEGYDDDPAPGQFRAAIRAFLAADTTALHAAAVPVFDYYRDIVALGYVDPDAPPPVIAAPDRVWEHVHPGGEVSVGREGVHVYVSVECHCDWEPEHGLQIVFRDGATVTKVGPYDGALTNPGGEVYRRLR